MTARPSWTATWARGRARVFATLAEAHECVRAHEGPSVVFDPLSVDAERVGCSWSSRRGAGRIQETEPSTVIVDCRAHDCPAGLPGAELAGMLWRITVRLSADGSVSVAGERAEGPAGMPAWACEGRAIEHVARHAHVAPVIRRVARALGAPEHLVAEVTRAWRAFTGGGRAGRRWEDAREDLDRAARGRS